MDQESIDVRDVFAIVNDPQYNAVRLHLLPEPTKEIGFGMMMNGYRALGDDDNANMVGRSERS